jgi:hypothetical protein
VDLRSQLEAGDLFVSYWLGPELTIVAGDRSDVRWVGRAEVGGLRDLVAAFERWVSRPDHYAACFAPRVRPGDWPAPVAAVGELATLLAALRSRLLPQRLEAMLDEGSFSRLLVFPDGYLHALPFEHLFLPGERWGDPGQLPRGVIYAPSGSAYAYARQRGRRAPPAQALVLVGDPEDPFLVQEAQRVEARISCRTARVTTSKELAQQTGSADLVYVVTHGEAPDPANPERGWALRFDGGCLGASDFYGGRVRLSAGATVVLSACSVGRMTAGPAHEIDGLVHGLFYAGAATVLAARWPVLEPLAVAVFAGALERVFRERIGASTALRLELLRAAGQPELRGYFAEGDVRPFFLGGFTLFGSGD